MATTATALVLVLFLLKLPIGGELVTEVLGDQSVESVGHGRLVDRRVFGPVWPVMEESPEVLVTELLVIHREQDQGVPAFVDRAWRREATKLIRQPEEPQGILEEDDRIFPGQFELGHDLDDHGLVLVPENPSKTGGTPGLLAGSVKIARDRAVDLFGC